MEMNQKKMTTFFFAMIFEFLLFLTFDRQLEGFTHFVLMQDTLN